ncbi:tetratricopeptide repeat protein [Bacillus salipaludis]|uniref:tetratricopeptide repeat protein n=1 Tax=Bacillus salipaludis TaxID=2547811 RepID=UPI003D236A49
MEANEQPLNQKLEKHPKKERVKNKKKNDKFNWWQTLLVLAMTLAVSISTGYVVTKKYLWPKYDMNRLSQQLESAKKEVDGKPNDSKARVDLGYAYFLNEDYDDAIKQYKTALDLDKNNFDAYFNLGLVYKEEKRYDDALKMAQKATELSPRDYKGHLLKGMSFRKIKMYSDAIKALNEANQLMPGNTDIIFEIGQVAEDKGDKKMAEDVYKEALGYDPMYKPAIEGLKRVAPNDKNS